MWPSSYPFPKLPEAFKFMVVSAKLLDKGDNIFLTISADCLILTFPSLVLYFLSK